MADVKVRQSPAWFTWIMRRILSGWVAITIGHTIYVARTLNEREMAHELVHVRQWDTVPAFPIRYLIASIRFGYRDNPYEVEARGN